MARKLQYNPAMETLCLGLAALLSLPAAPTPAPVDFEREISPLLAKHCHRCHGATRQKGELRLDVRRLALEGGLGGRAIVPGKAGESLLVRLVEGKEPGKLMPPEGEPLGASQVEILRRWIDEGALWPESASAPVLQEAPLPWAYRPIVRPRIPSVRAASRPRNPIDQFVLARLEAEGLTLAPEADPWTLARRAALDTTGLAPTPELADALAEATESGSYELCVDALLSSPQHGELWARRWLDLARYADTNGYEKDKPRVMWRYRDYVIRAINEDLPYDRFLVEQLAGDLLPGPTHDQIIATGFHRNTMINEEGGADQEQFRYEAIVDRVNTTGAALLGLTLGCAQCHSHKYDPVSQREYFQLYAFFNNAEEPRIESPTGEEQRALDAHAQSTAAAESALVAPAPELDSLQPLWEAEAVPEARPWRALEALQVTSQGGAELTRLPDGSWLAGGPSPGADTYEVELAQDGFDLATLRIEALPHDSLPLGGPGRGRVLGDGNFLLSEVTLTISSPEREVSSSEGPPEARGSRAVVPLAWAAADHAQGGFEAARAIDGDLETGWSIEAGKPGKNVERRLVLELKQPLGANQLKGARLTLVHNYTHEQNLGRFRISGTAVSRAGASPGRPPAIERALLTPKVLRSGEEVAALRRQYCLESPLRKAERERLEELARGRPHVTTALVLRERERPRATHLKLRGDFSRDGDLVEPGTPRALPPLPPGAPANRLTLARWIASPTNPLTARVAVNRIWSHYFGRGLVATLEDLGARADPPTHPELLDWLALELVESGWSLKAIHRLILTSSVYRQSSSVPADLLQRDPLNLLLGRAPRLRLEAEPLRDHLLAASGLLNLKLGGPSVYPPIADGGISPSYGGFDWPTSTGGDRYRRGLYTFAKRTSPYPTSITFDAPSGETACLRRVRTSTPLQALTLLNDTVPLEAARALARKTLAEAPPDRTARVRWAFRVCLTRAPEEGELTELVDFVATRSRKLEREGSAAQIATGGEPPPAGIDLNELAALTLLARVLLNLDEMITRP